MADQTPLAVALFSELLAADARLKARITKILPFRLELSHFMVLNHLAGAGRERAPVDLARAFNQTKGAMTNTLSKLEAQGYIHIRPDWDDGRRKWISISEAGLDARDLAVRALEPLFAEVLGGLSDEEAKAGLRFLRRLRALLD